MNICHECKNGKYKFGFICLDSCEPGYYENNTTMACESCDPSCVDCTTSAVACTACNDGYYL